MEKDSRLIRRVSMVDQVSDGIKEYIQHENMQPGDKLPTEMVLADTFGVNRFTVRMALQKLVTIGTIETRVGEGSFVKSFSVRDYFDQIADIGFANESMADIYQVRKIIEGEAIRSAVERATPEELELLREKAEKCAFPFRLGDDVPAEEYEAAVERDIAFHQYLCVCSHNKLFEKIYTLLKPQLKEYALSIIMYGVKAVPQPVLDSYDNVHMELYRAIASKDARLGVKILEHMLEPRRKPQ